MNNILKKNTNFIALIIFLFGAFACYYGSMITAPQISSIDSNVVATINEGFYHGQTDKQKQQLNTQGVDVGEYNIGINYKYNFIFNDSILSFLRQKKVDIKVDDNLLSASDGITTWKNTNTKTNFDNPVNVDLGQFDSSKKLNIKALNTGSDVGILVQSSLNDFGFFIWIFLANIFLILGLWILIIRILKLPVEIFVIFGFGILIKEYYLYYTGYINRQHDWGGTEGHGGYVEYIVNNFRLPPPEGWEYHQSAGWYVLMAIVSWILKALGVFDISFIRSSWQVFNIAFFSGFVLISGIIIQKILNLKNKFSLALAFGVLSFFPSGIIHSPRITNDLLFYFVYSLVLLSLVNWLKSRQKKYFWLSTLVLSIAFLVKTSTILLIPVYILAIIFYFLPTFCEYIKTFKGVNLENTETIIKDSWSKFKKNILITILVPSLTLILIGGGYILGNYSKIALFIASDGQKSLLVPNLQVSNSDLSTPNTLDHYVYFNLETFVKKPFTNPFAEGQGRENFWNYFLKTSLFGEFNLDSQYDTGKTHFNLAVIISVLFVILVIIGILALFSQKISDFNFPLILILSDLLVESVGVARYHFISPCACNQDFRFGYVALIGLVTLFFLPKTKRLNIFNNIILVVFIISNIVFFINPF